MRRFTVYVQDIHNTNEVVRATGAVLRGAGLGRLLQDIEEGYEHNDFFDGEGEILCAWLARHWGVDVVEGREEEEERAPEFLQDAALQAAGFERGWVKRVTGTDPKGRGLFMLEGDMVTRREVAPSARTVLVACDGAERGARNFSFVVCENGRCKATGLVGTDIKPDWLRTLLPDVQRLLAPAARPVRTLTDREMEPVEIMVFSCDYLRMKKMARERGIGVSELLNMGLDALEQVEQGYDTNEEERFNPFTR